MITVGIDFAAQPSNTAVARVAWLAGGARVQSILKPADDAAILRAIAEVDAVGIDVPFGWPDAFVQYIAEHRDDTHSPTFDDPDEWRRGLAFRLTDRIVAHELRKQPLSVATDRIGLATMRASSLLASIRASGERLDRAGGARIAEVYPAAALKGWGLPFTGYKRANAGNRDALVDQLLAAAPWLQMGAFEASCRDDDDALDAVVAALIARAHALGHWHRPTDVQLEQARREGWMVVPACELAQLAVAE